MPPSPQTPLWLRLAFIILGLATLLWLPIEDTSPRSAILLAVFSGLLLGAFVLLRRGANPCRRPWVCPLVGAVLGVAIPILAVFLLVFKSGLHAHGFPDFTYSELTGLLRAVPFTALIGALAGLLATVWQRRGSQDGVG